MKWLVALSEFHIVYQPHTTLKAQVLTDFVAKFTHFKQNEGLKGALPLPPTEMLNVNELANAHGSGVKMILKTLDNTIIE